MIEQAEGEGEGGGIGFAAVGEEIWLEADDKDVAGPGAFEGLVEEVGAAGGGGQAEVEGGEAAGLLDDLGIDGEGGTGSAGEEDERIAGAGLAGGGDFRIAALDGVTPEFHLRVGRDGEPEAQRVGGEHGG